MKKLALTNLIVLFAIKSVSACSYISGSKKPILEMLDEISLYTNVYLFSIISLFIVNSAIIFLREKRDNLFLAIIIILALIMTCLTFFGIIMEGCDLLFSTLKLELVIISVITSLHLLMWATNLKLPDWRIEKGDMISLELK